MDLYPANPRYLRIDDEPTILMGSGEHYGALLNLDFDYATYLRTLGGYGLNQTRVFSGTYRERPGHFGIEANTLAPQPGRYIGPWVEVEPDRFDLERLNPAWFDRLRDLLGHAKRNGVVVELVLFCFWYGDDHWRASPMHPQSNTAGIGTEERNLVYALDGNQLLPVQESAEHRPAPRAGALRTRPALPLLHPGEHPRTHEEHIEVKGRFHRLLTPAWSGDLAFRITPLGG